MTASFLTLYCKRGIHFAQVDVSFSTGRAEASPLGGIDYPRTLQEFDDWFATKDKCANYLIMTRAGKPSTRP